jgi:hypothetical protein
MLPEEFGNNGLNLNCQNVKEVLFLSICLEIAKVDFVGND